LHFKWQPGENLEVEKRRYGDGELFRRLLKQARPYWLHLAGVFLLSLLAAPLALLGPLPLKLAVDSALGSQPLPASLRALFGGTAPPSSGTVLILVVVLLLAITLLLYLQALSLWILTTFVGEKLVLEFRALLFRHVQRLSIAYHDNMGTSDSTYRIQYDAPAIQYILTNGIIPLISAALTLFGMIYVTARLDWRLALVALGVCPALSAATRTFGRRVRSQWHDLKKFDSAAMSVVQEALSAVRVVKAFGREDHEQGRFLRESGERVQREIRLSFVQGTFDLVIGMILAIGTAAVLYLGVSHVRSGSLSLGSLLLVMAYLAQLYDPLKTLSKKMTDLQSSLTSAERTFALLDESPDVAEKTDARSILKADGAVTFRDVSFCYEDGHPVLQHVSFEVVPGARVGIAGPTGAGKTTLVNLLTRFYDPNSGSILLDGVDLREYRVADLRNQFALMLQEPVLFSTSISENIAYARPDATTAEIMEAAKAANAHEFVMNLPQGYDTLVGERGMRLSGGERQRISLARAFLKNAPLLILDEPTSSVDDKTETGIMDTMERLMNDRTVFIIAHRLGTLKNCDIMLRLEEGILVNAEPIAHAASPKGGGLRA
jgi:ATP-binding cassette, subfamily B, bacterial